MDFVLNKGLENSDLVYVDLIIAKNINELRKLLEELFFRKENLGKEKENFEKSLGKNKENLVVVRGGNSEINRAALENKRVDILLGPELNQEKDFIHFRNSGLNQVLCKLAKKNDVAIGFSFSDLINSEKRELTLGRMMQNVFLCRKYKLKIILGSFAKKENEIKNSSELKSFGAVLGMNGKEINESLNFKKKEAKIRILK